MNDRIDANGRPIEVGMVVTKASKLELGPRMTVERFFPGHLSPDGASQAGCSYFLEDKLQRVAVRCDQLVVVEGA